MPLQGDGSVILRFEVWMEGHEWARNSKNDECCIFLFVSELLITTWVIALDIIINE